MSIDKIWRSFTRRMNRFEMDDLLHAVRLERRRTFAAMMVPMMGMIVAGVAIGAGLGLMLAPSSGRLLRKNMEHRIGQLREKMQHGDMKNAVGERLNASSTTG